MNTDITSQDVALYERHMKRQKVNNTMPQENNYNGWANKSTWNVALYINNDESLYNAACEFMQDGTKYSRRRKNPYRYFVCHYGMQNDKTPDGIKWLSNRLDYPALNDMMLELIEG